MARHVRCAGAYVAGATAHVCRLFMAVFFVYIRKISGLVSGDFLPIYRGTSAMYWKKLFLVFCLVMMPPVFAMTPPGTVINNVANATFDIGAATGLNESSNIASVTTTIIRTPSSITLLQYLPAAPTVTEETPSQCRNGAGGAFIGSADPAVPLPGSGTTTLDPNTPLGLAPATIYNVGEPVFVQLSDGDQNIDPAAAETVVVTVTSSLGDTEELLLTETDLDTGVFIGYVQSTDNPVTSFNCELTVDSQSTLQADYSDPFDGSDTASSTTLVDPFGVIFNSLDGQPVDGVTVQLVNVTTGQPAVPGVDIFGNDGISAFPNTLVSGGTATDSGGTVYNFPAGSYRFPLLLPGRYRLDIITSPGFISPSSASISDLQNLPAAPFALLDNASYGQDFVLNPGPPLHVDIPLDPIATQLIVNKAASITDAGIGDFVQYQVTLENADLFSAAVDTRIDDVLPRGFRYQPGSVRLNGSVVADPAIAANGRALEFAVGNLAPGASLNISYVAEVTAGTPLGAAVNTASARDTVGATSNVAQAVVDVRDEFLRERNILVGRVLVGNCPLLPEEHGQAALRMQSEKHEDEIDYRISFSVNDAEINSYKLIVTLPDTLQYASGSARLDGRLLGDPQVAQQTLTFSFDDRRFEGVLEWERVLEFETRVVNKNHGRFVTEAYAVMNTATEQNQTTPIARNILLRKAARQTERQFVFRPLFAPLNAELTAEEIGQLDKIIGAMRDSEIININIEGHTDARPISHANRSLYNDNLELSWARAKTLAPYFQAQLGLRGEQIKTLGLGDAKPIADNATPDGQMLNRRVDVSINARVQLEPEVDKIILDDSGELLMKLVTHNKEREPAQVGTELRGLPGARIYLEDGTYVLTDENGKYHIEGVRPGTHVVQLDLESLPPNVRVIECEQNTRFAGTPYSRFVDLKPGSLWRVDFHVEEEAPAVGQASLQMKTRIDDGVLAYRVENSGGEVPVRNYRLTVILPEGTEYIESSSLLGEEALDDPQVSGNILVYRLGDFSAGWNETLKFRARIKTLDDRKLVTKAAAILDTAQTAGVRVPPVQTVALVQGRKLKPRDYVFKPKFGTLRAELSLSDKRKLDSLIPELLSSEIQQIQIIGHTDNVPISVAGRKLYKDNYALSQARAETVAGYLQQVLGLREDQVIAKGMGPDQPLVSNATAEGRAQNRRTEILINAVEAEGVDVSTMLQPASQVSSAKIAGEVVPVESVKPVTLPPSTKRSIQQFDKAWLEQAQPGVEWLMPVSGYIPSIPALNVAIKHHPGDSIIAQLNGEPLNPLFFFGMEKNKKGNVARSYWQGIHLKEGANKLEFIVRDVNDGAETVLQRVIYYSGAPVRAELVKEYSSLIADGKTPPVLAVRFYDKWEQPVRPGVIGEFSVQPPYQSKERLDSMEEDLLAAYDRNQPVYEIGEHGIALIELEPTSQTGKAILGFVFNDGRAQQIDAWLKPASRDWIVVGVVDGTLGDNTLSGNTASAESNGFEDGSYDDGKLAFFAKGNLNADWLLTASVDSSKDDDNVGNSLFQTIDPDEFFTLYGDNTEQRYEAPSSEKVFLKLERQHFYALFGDYDTGLNATELSKYNRSVTGLKSEFEGDVFSFNFFATETSHRFAKDEIQGNGTSGLYQLSRNDIVINSEVIVLETRDRFRSQDILERRTLRRHYDYNIDYQAGTVFFKEPVTSRDRNFNPVFIVVDYETRGDIEDDATFGGRGAFHFASDKAELGFTAINDGTFALEGDLQGVDLSVQTGKDSELRLEFASSEVDDAGTLREGDAYLAEFSTRGEKLDARIYMREQESEFGLGQQAGSESGTRKYGADGSYRLNSRLQLNSEIFHEQNLVTDAERDVAEAGVSYTVNQHSFNAGLRSARDELINGQKNESELLVLGAATKLYDGKLHLHADSEIALNSEDANPAYPTRHILGLDYFLTPNVNAYLEQEFTEGALQDTSATRIGFRATPWSQARIDTSVEEQTGEYGPRTFAVLGLAQGFRINQRWSADLSFDRSETMRDGGAGNPPFNVNVPSASGTLNDDFTAVSLGSTYRADTATWVNRFEHRDADSEDRLGLFIGWHRDLQEGIAFGVDAQWFDSDFLDGSETTDGDIRFSLSYRPVTSKWIHLNRLDYKFDERVDTAGNRDRSRKLINNWKGNYMPNRDHQLALSYGIKYVLDNFSGAEYDGVTHYIGSEYRYDIGKHWDLGVHASRLHSVNSDNLQYSYGLSTGWDLAKNLWLSVGYNFDGFEDDDFSLADYTAKGPFIKLRLKFDQNTLGINR